MICLKEDGANQVHRPLVQVRLPGMKRLIDSPG
jgi:hypothetical protein